MPDINDPPEFETSERDTSPEETGKPVSPADEKLLEQIRKDYKYCLNYWREIREEAAIDIQYAAGNPWTQDDLNEREGRPCLTPDELSQYLKQANNNLRQNKRAIQVEPKGEGATDGDAKWRRGVIEGIQEASGAQAAYTTAFEGATSAYAGFWKITLEYVDETSANVQPRIKRIPNLFTVLMDPNAKEADFSDSRRCFVTDVMRKDDFAERYPKARKTSFSTDDMNMAPDWFQGEDIVIAEYWHVKESTRKKLWVKTKQGPMPVYEDEREKFFEKNQKLQVLKSRQMTKRVVTQYITNGVEILETNAWPGSWIPVVGIFGEEIYSSEGGASKRMFFSLIRRARVPQKMLAFIASQEQEEFSMSPRSPLFLWEGQEQADEKALIELNKVPRSHIKLKLIRDEVSGQLITQPPMRIPFTPNIEAYEAAYERWRRAVQASVGVVPLPSAAQRQSEKSGVALERIQTQEATGAYHFLDNFDRALRNTGRQLNELITLTMDTPRQVAVPQPDGTKKMLVVTSKDYLELAKKQFNLEEGGADYLVTDRGEFDVTISTGPNHQSQREESSDFVDKLLSEAGNLPIPPQVGTKILAKAIKLKNLGAVGDQIAELLDPPDMNNLPPAAQAAVSGLQGQLQQAQQELAALHMERAAKQLEIQFKLQVEKMRQQGIDRKSAWDYATRVVVAELAKGSKADEIVANLNAERELHMLDVFDSAHNAAHDVGMALLQHQQATDQANQQAALQAQQAQAPADQGAESNAGA